jgi:hypothetical protein
METTRRETGADLPETELRAMLRDLGEQHPRRELAALLEVSLTTLTEVQAGRRAPSPRFRAAVCRCAGRPATPSPGSSRPRLIFPEGRNDLPDAQAVVVLQQRPGTREALCGMLLRAVRAVQTGAPAAQIRSLLAQADHWAETL